MPKKSIFAIILLFVVLLVPYSARAADKYDGEYTGTINTSNDSFTKEMDISTKMVDSDFTFDTGWELLPFEQLSLLTAKYDVHVSGQVDGSGIVSGLLTSRIGFCVYGLELAAWEVESPIHGTVKEGTLQFLASGEPINVKCPWEGNCGGAEVVNFAADLSKTATSNNNFWDQPETDDYTQRIDQSLPIMEKVIGEVTMSDQDKKTGFWDSLNNHLNYGEGNVDVNGHRVDYDRVWEEGKSGTTLKVGDEIRTGNGRVVLKFADGTKFILMENTLLRKTADGFKIENGVVASTFWKTGNKVRLITKHGNFMVKGTKFAIAAGDENSVIEVYEGVVQVTQSADQIVDVTADQSVSIDDRFIEPADSIDSSTNLQQWNDIESEIQANSTNYSAISGIMWIVLIAVAIILFVAFVAILILVLAIRSVKRK